jgi:hypothetical protein
MKFEFHFIAFFIAFLFGIIVIFVFSDPQQIYIKNPNPFNSNKVVYTNDVGECYKIKVKEIKCKGKEKEHNYSESLTA